MAEFSFCVFMDRDEVEVHKNANLVTRTYIRDVSAHSDSRNENGRNKQFLDNAFTEVNITI